MISLNKNSLIIKIMTKNKEELKEKEIKQRQITFNALTAKEWTALSKNVWDDLSSPREPHHLEHGAVFPLKLVERIIKIYSKEGDLVFDPFVGTGTTVIGAYNLKRSGIGIELVPRFVEIANNWLNNLRNLFDETERANLEYSIINDDCRNLEKYVKKNSVQLTFTSPPYANFIQRSLDDRRKTHKNSKIVLENKSVIKQYSDLEDDFGNLEYPLFLKEIKKILKANLNVTKPGGYSMWVVKDYRDTKNGKPYIDFHSDLAKVAQQAGWLYHDLIIWDQNKQRSLILLGYPSVFYTNQNCSFIVVFRKKL